GGKRNGKGYRAPCPAHEDKDPSLDIADGISGRPVFICRAGCTNDPVLAARKRRGLWPEGSDDNPKRNGAVTDIALPPHPQLGQQDHRWDYYDSHGHLIGAVLRWNRASGKEIRPASFDGAKWKWEGFRKPTPLYRLPDILAQPKRAALVVEGEKTAEAARELVDMNVTPWAHGASAVGQADW